MTRAMVVRQLAVQPPPGGGSALIIYPALRTVRRSCRSALRLDLLPQLADVHVDHVRLRVEVIVPDVLEQHGARDDLAGMAHEVLEELELARLQLDGARAARDLAGEQVDAQIAHFERGLRGILPAAPAEHVDAREQLAEREGLGEIVVATGAQALDPLVDVAERAQDQDRGVIVRLAQRIDDGEAIDVARQHAVHDDDVVALADGEEEAVAAVLGVIGGVARLRQSLGDESRHPLVVLDDEDLHELLDGRQVRRHRHGSGFAHGARPATMP